MLKNRLNWNLLSRYRTEIMGFMCILIVLYHYKNNMIYPEFLSPVKKLLEFGNIGVDVFLFVSGIGLYFAFQKSREVIPFYKKRLVRIVIPYILLCVPYYVWLNLTTDRNLLLLDITQLSLPLKNTITTWYLPAITVFYLLFPLIYKLEERKTDIMRIAATALMCVVWVFLLILMSRTASNIYHNCEIALARLPVFMVGCCFGKFVYEKRKIPFWIFILSAIFILIYPFIYYGLDFTIFRERLSYVPLAIAISLVLGFAFSLLPEKNLIFRVLRFFGVHSLEIYVIHVLINNIWAKAVGAHQHFDRYGLIDYAIIIILSLLLSVIAHYVIEKTSNRILRKSLPKE